jgi:hypothetical protein
VAVVATLVTPRTARSCSSTVARHDSTRDRAAALRREDPRARQQRFEHQAAARLEPEVGVAQVRKAANQPTGTRNQGDRQRDLDDDHRLQQPMRGDACRRAPATLVHQHPQARARQPERGCEADEERCDQEDAEREQQHTHVERHAIEPRQLGRAEREQQAHACGGECQADHGAAGGNDQRLGEELPDDAAASGAERNPYRDLP